MSYFLRALRRTRLSFSLLFAVSTVLLACLLVAHLALQDVPATIAALDEAYDPQTALSTAATNASTPRILLVSAYFPLPTSKHSPEEYNTWLGNFLSHITTPVYFYTPPAFAPTIRVLRGDLPMTLDTALEGPFEVPPLRGREAQYEAMHAKDREAFRHTPLLYAVWNAKPWLLEHALDEARAQGETYDFAFWCDAGSFRAAHRYRAWPDPARVGAVFSAAGTPPNSEDAVGQDQVFIPLASVPPRAARFWTPSLGPLDTPAADIAEGSFFGGPASALPALSASFYAFHGTHLARGEFVGKDQTILNALLLLAPQRFRSVVLRDPAAPARELARPVWGLDAGYLGACGSEWFYYQFFLAGRGEREKMREVWVEEAAQRSWWGAQAWWRARQPCRLTGAVGVRELLEREFGAEWTPPQAEGA